MVTVFINGADKIIADTGAIVRVISVTGKFNPVVTV
jgi:hypothetical protein